MTVWTAQEARRFLQGIKDDPLRALWTLALTTGMRRGELLGLKWTDVDLESARLSVRRSLAVVDGGPVESEPKTRRGRRSISLDESTVALLRQHRAEQAAQRLALGKPFTGGEYIFVSPDGHPIHPDTVTKRSQVLARRAKLPRIRFHDLRHTHATLALQAGVHPKVVSERLGHASTVITLDTYSHAVPALEEEAAARIASLLSGGAS
jgi:integrase